MAQSITSRKPVFPGHLLKEQLQREATVATRVPIGRECESSWPVGPMKLVETSVDMSYTAHTAIQQGSPCGIVWTNGTCKLLGKLDLLVRLNPAETKLLRHNGSQLWKIAPAAAAATPPKSCRGGKKCVSPCGWVGGWVGGPGRVGSGSGRVGLGGVQGGVGSGTPRRTI